MIMRNLVTMALTAFVSTLATLWLSGHSAPTAETLRVRNIELVDHQNRVRGTIGLRGVGGLERPEITLRNEDGKTMVLLSLNSRGDGTLYFSSERREGKVGVGYLWGSDVIAPGGTEVTDATNSTGAWGLRVAGQDSRTITLGFTNAGRVLVPPR